MRVAHISGNNYDVDLKMYNILELLLELYTRGVSRPPYHPLQGCRRRRNLLYRSFSLRYGARAHTHLYTRTRTQTLTRRRTQTHTNIYMNILCIQPLILAMMSHSCGEGHPPPSDLAATPPPALFASFRHHPPPSPAATTTTVCELCMRARPRIDQSSPAVRRNAMATTLPPTPPPPSDARTHTHGNTHTDSKRVHSTLCTTTSYPGGIADPPNVVVLVGNTSRHLLINYV